MPKYKLIFADTPIEVYICDDGDWRHDSVFIWNNNGSISSLRIDRIVQYLYDEGYIKDRRTRYEIFNDKKIQ